MMTEGSPLFPASAELPMPPLVQPEPTDVMLDLETLGRRPFSAILSIGACALRLDDSTEPTVRDVFYQPIELQSCIDAGLRIEGETLEWWMGQTPDAVKVFTDSTRVKLPLALDAFTDWLQSRPLKLWGNSAKFDLGILESAYFALGKTVPWGFRDERCYRTVKELPGAKAISLERVGTYHNALDDAISQALHLRAINRLLQLHL